MTNDEIMKLKMNAAKGWNTSPQFRLRHSFVIRHSLFVISLVVALTFALAACNSSKRLTKANVDEVAEGMAKKQVESILGLPTTVDTKDLQLLKKTTYVYTQGKDSVTIVFKDDKVQSKASTLSD
jgi:outer membrane protein assembly factor BamE (lipoprotein component of BamABCDE complex)